VQAPRHDSAQARSQFTKNYAILYDFVFMRDPTEVEDDIARDCRAAYWRHCSIVMFHATDFRFTSSLHLKAGARNWVVTGFSNSAESSIHLLEAMYAQAC
jgi:hypothetical protein